MLVFLAAGLTFLQRPHVNVFAAEGMRCSASHSGQRINRLAVCLAGVALGGSGRVPIKVLHCQQSYQPWPLGMFWAALQRGHFTA